MNSEELKRLATQVAALTGVLQESGHQTVQAVSQGVSQLQHAANTLGQQGRQMTDEVVHAVGARAASAMQQGLQQALERCSQALHQAAQEADRTAARLQTQSTALERRQRGLIWKSSLGLLLGAVLAAGGSGYLAWRSWQESRRAQFSADILQATQSGLLNQCEGVLCVKVDRNAARFGKNDAYVLLRP